MLAISYAFLNRIYPFVQGIYLHVTVTGKEEGNVEIFCIESVFDILQLQWHITGHICADDIR